MRPFHRRPTRPLRWLPVCVWLLLAAALSAAGPAPARAQQAEVAVSDSLFEVRLADGGTYIGRITAVEGDTITLESTAGVRIQFSRAQVVSIRPARGRVEEGRFWREDPNLTRLFFSPTGRSLGRGEGYFGVYELFIPFVAYGVTDRLLIAGGSPFYLAFTGDVSPPFYFGPKYQVLRRDRVQASVGALTVVSTDGEGDAFGILYGVGTLGGADNAATLGVGWGYVGDDLSSKPVVMAGGEARVSQSIKLITENLFVPGENGVILSGGVRFFGERLSADAGLAAFAGDGDGGCCLPLVNFVYHFGMER